MPRLSPTRFRTSLLSVLALAACDLAYPEVVVVNRTTAQTQLRRLSYNGCAWDTVLAYGEATAPSRCLPGRGRVHFQRLDAAAFCRDQARHGTIDGVCPCDSEVETDRTDVASTNEVPTWFNYQTLTVHRADYGEFRIFEIEAGDMEQDFSVPGPYGH